MKKSHFLFSKILNHGSLISGAIPYVYPGAYETIFLNIKLCLQNRRKKVIVISVPPYSIIQNKSLIFNY
jgi:hypothetical protein